MSRMQTGRVLRTASVLALAAGVSAGGALAQTRAALVRSVDEPARVPYGSTIAPTCPFTNDCNAEWPVVPAGKRLRVTAISAVGYQLTSGATYLLALHRNNANGPGMVWAAPLPAFNGAFYGAMVAANQAVDLYFEAGEKPAMEFGIISGGSTLNANSIKLTLTGYLVDTAP